MNGGWTKIAALLVKAHAEHGAASVDEQGPTDGRGKITLGREVEPLLVLGREITAKQVKRWLWENRQACKKASCVWSAYLDEVDASVVGLGTLEANP